MASELGSSIILVPVIAILGNVAIAKTFCKLFFKFMLKNLIAPQRTFYEEL
jgi:hypothetical protein